MIQLDDSREYLINLNQEETIALLRRLIGIINRKVMFECEHDDELQSKIDVLNEKYIKALQEISRLKASNTKLKSDILCLKIKQGLL